MSPVSLAAPATAKPTGGDKRAPAMLVPFTRAAREHLEPFVDESKLITTSSQQLGPYDVAAYGFLRGIYLQLDASGGAGGAAVVALKEDAPWSIIQELSVIDVNGAPIFGPVSGHDLYLLNKYGGHAWSADPKQSPAYSAPVTGSGGSGNFSAILRIPIEISARDALGSLPNQNAASTYKVRITLAAAADVYSVLPATTLPTVRLRAHLDAWSQPTGSDLRGNVNAQVPPAVGTTMFSSKQIFNQAAGQQTTQLKRVGNYLRNLIFVNRDTANGTRATGATNFPDPFTFSWDTRPLLTSVPRRLIQHIMQQRTGYTAAAEAAGGPDNGVFVIDFAHDFDGKIGAELRDGWLGTVQSTRLELQGTYAAASVLTVLTTDVSPAGEVFV